MLKNLICCGYGGDFVQQDNAQFMKTVTEYENKNIPYAVYIKSYAQTKQSLSSEIGHILRLITNHCPSVVYIDIREYFKGSQSLSNIMENTINFCDEISIRGYCAGVYIGEESNQSYLDTDIIKSKGYEIIYDENKITPKQSKKKSSQNK